MTTDLVRQRLEGTLKAGSLKDLLRERQAARETHLLLDCSGSMGAPVQDGSRTRRIDALRTIAADLRDSFRAPQVGFGLSVDDAVSVGFIQGVPEPNGGTPLHLAIDFSAAHGAKHLIVVSDGAPDSQPDALASAHRFGGLIDCFYVGPASGPGGRFLAQLASVTKGRYQSASLAQPKQLTAAIRGLLTAAPPET